VENREPEPAVQHLDIRQSATTESLMPAKYFNKSPVLNEYINSLYLLIHEAGTATLRFRPCGMPGKDNMIRHSNLAAAMPALFFT